MMEWLEDFAIIEWASKGVKHFFIIKHTAWHEGASTDMNFMA